MILTKQTDIDWSYPVLAFLRDGDLRYFDDPFLLTEFPYWVYRDDLLPGMELIDSKGEQWFVRAVELTSPEPRPRRWWQIWPFWEEPRAVLDLGLEEGGKVPFATVRQRACDYHLTTVDPDDEDMREADEETLTALKRAKNILDIGDALHLAEQVGFFD